MSDCNHLWLPAHVDTQHATETVEEVYCMRCTEVRTL